jgi:hypothetical protein
MESKCGVCDVPEVECSLPFREDERTSGRVCARCLDGLRAFGYNENVLADALHYVMNGINNP